MKLNKFLLFLFLLYSYNSYSQNTYTTGPYGFVTWGPPTAVGNDYIEIPVTFRFYSALKAIGKTGEGYYLLFARCNVTYAGAYGKTTSYLNYTSNQIPYKIDISNVMTTDSLETFTLRIGNLIDENRVYSLQPYCTVDCPDGTSMAFYQDSTSAITFTPTLAPIPNNYITSDNQVLCPQGTPPTYYPGQITAGMPGGGNGDYAFTWQQSTNGAEWTSINSDVALLTCTPPPVQNSQPYTTVYYRRIITSGTQADTSNRISITYLPAGYQPVMNITSEESSKRSIVLKLEVNNLSPDILSPGTTAYLVKCTP